MNMPKVRRRWIVLAIVAVLVFTAYRMLDARSTIDYYRVVDPQTLMVGTGEGARCVDPGHQRRRDASDGPITVDVLLVPARPKHGEGVSASNSVAHLQAPLGDRTVIDGSTGLAVQRATCPPPSISAPACP